MTQAREHLAVLEQVLLSLEKPGEPADNRERIDRCFRLVHSLKGDAGFLGYTAVRTLANAMETVLEAMRNRRSRPRPRHRATARRHETASRRSWMIWRTASGADLREILAQLELVERSPHRVPQPGTSISVRWIVSVPAASRDSSRRSSAAAWSLSPRISHGVARSEPELPQGPIHFQLGSHRRGRRKRSAQISDCRRSQ